MINSKRKPETGSELKINGILAQKGVRVSEKQSVDELSSRGYGVAHYTFGTRVFSKLRMKEEIALTFRDYCNAMRVLRRMHGQDTWFTGTLEAEGTLSGKGSVQVSTFGCMIVETIAKIQRNTWS
jgi:hypothetical protein